jgi:hypothetical protein
MNDMRKLMEAVKTLNEATGASVFLKLQKKLEKIPEIKVKVSKNKIHITGPGGLDIDAELYQEEGSSEPWVNFQGSEMSGNDPASQFYWTALADVVRTYEEFWFFEPGLSGDKEENEEYWADAGMSRKHCYKVLKYLDPNRELSNEPPYGKKLKPW